MESQSYERDIQHEAIFYRKGSIDGISIHGMRNMVFSYRAPGQSRTDIILAYKASANYHLCYRGKTFYYLGAKPVGVNSP